MKKQTGLVKVHRRRVYHNAVLAEENIVVVRPSVTEILKMSVRKVQYHEM